MSGGGVRGTPGDPSEFQKRQMTFVESRQNLFKTTRNFIDFDKLFAVDEIVP